MTANGKIRKKNKNDGWREKETEEKKKKWHEDRCKIEYVNNITGYKMQYIL